MTPEEVWEDYMGSDCDLHEDGTLRRKNGEIVMYPAGGAAPPWSQETTGGVMKAFVKTRLFWLLCFLAVALPVDIIFFRSGWWGAPIGAGVYLLVLLVRRYA